MLDNLRDEVCRANTGLVTAGLVIQTWGNVSARDQQTGYVVIKPSGVAYEELTPDMMVITDLEGKVVEGSLRPSSDLLTHIQLYRSFKGVGAVVHTHSRYATSWAQAKREIPVMGTTHADYFYGDIPCTRKMKSSETENDYELNTGKVIAERFADIDPLKIPAVLVAGHGPFCWGENPHKALENAVVLEEISRMAFYTVNLGGNERIDKSLLDKHFLRKHGRNSYYGQ